MDPDALATLLRTEALSLVTLVGAVVERLLDDPHADVERIEILVLDAQTHSESAFELAARLTSSTSK